MNMKQELTDWIAVSRDRQVAGWVFLLLRFYLGYFYIQTGLNKVERGDWGLAYKDSLVSFVEGALEKTYGWYGAFLEGVVLPNPEIFTILVSWGELLLGISLLFGISTRLSGYLGAFMALNFALASGRALWLPSFDALLAYTLFTLGVAAVGRNFGIDRFLVRKWPNAKIW